MESPSNFQVKEEEKLFKSVHKQGNWTFVVQSHLRECTISDLESPSNFQVKELQKLFKSVQKQRYWTFVVKNIHKAKLNNLDGQNKLSLTNIVGIKHKNCW